MLSISVIQRASYYSHESEQRKFREFRVAQFFLSTFIFQTKWVKETAWDQFSTRVLVVYTETISVEEMGNRSGQQWAVQKEYQIKIYSFFNSSHVDACGSSNVS